MTDSYKSLVEMLKRLPGVGYRSAERMALHLLLERPEELLPLAEAMQRAQREVKACSTCGNLAEGSLCEICANDKRQKNVVCVVERVPDLVALERAGGYKGVYHVLNGRLSPMNGVGPMDLNLESLRGRIAAAEVSELILALGNDIEGEATCHYILQEVVKDAKVRVSRIAFGIPSGASLTYSDQITLKSAMDGRRELVGA